VDKSFPSALHEAKLLNLATDKAFHLLGWKSAWDFEQSVARTVIWYRHCIEGNYDFQSLTRDQILTYVSDGIRLGLKWATSSLGSE
jgi:CDP-glucose 4,6-dehydratase